MSSIPQPDSLVHFGLGTSQESSSACGRIALIIGGVTAAVGVLLAVGIDSALSGEDGTSASTRYLVAGGVGFGVGAGYTLVRCRLERAP